jgi:hypothetical protein
MLVSAEKGVRADYSLIGDPASMREPGCHEWD